MVVLTPIRLETVWLMIAERGSGSTRDPLEALVTPLVIRPSVIKL